MIRGILLGTLHFYRTTNEVRDIHRKQLEDLEIRVSNYKHNEVLLNEEITKLKTNIEKLQSDYEKVCLFKIF